MPGRLATKGKTAGEFVDGAKMPLPLLAGNILDLEASTAG